MNKAYKTFGLTACFIAILAMSGGHWLVLQSVAWARMIVEFSQRDPLGTAIAKTFDGRHPCALCLQVRQGQAEERERGEKLPWEKREKVPELFYDAHRAALPAVPTIPAESPGVALDFFYDFVESPPKPPPRAKVAVL